MHALRLNLWYISLSQAFGDLFTIELTIKKNLKNRLPENLIEPLLVLKVSSQKY